MHQEPVKVIVPFYRQTESARALGRGPEHSLCLEDLGLQPCSRAAPTAGTAVAARESELPVSTLGPEPDASVSQPLPLNPLLYARSSPLLPHGAAHKALRMLLLHLLGLREKALAQGRRPRPPQLTGPPDFTDAQTCLKQSWRPEMAGRQSASWGWPRKLLGGLIQSFCHLISVPISRGAAG